MVPKIIKLLSTARKKIPLITIFVHMVVVSIFYRECIGGTTTNFNKKIVFLIYYALLCIICFLWELYCILEFYKNKYSFNRHKSRFNIGLLSAFISLLVFICGSYYFDTKGPFNCLFIYYNSISIFLICYGCIMLVCFSIFERFIWGIQKSVLPIESNYDNNNIIGLIINEPIADDRERIESQLENDYNNMDQLSFYEAPLDQEFQS